ncbi:MAG TPA: NADH-quinone oxidoreductase subunit NuoE [Firmicutes bacterium]|nr:NADH-quinone oxidoreductase subunit NuoE [Bacillota bacterium]
MEAKKCCGCQQLHDPRYEQLEQLIKHYQSKKGALVPLLHEAQEIFGYLPEEVQRRVADGLGIPLSEVYGVATFYSLFSLKPRGKHKIGVCLGTACYVRGAGAILAELEKELAIKVNDTTADGKFTLEITRCIGACGLAPVMTVDEDVFGRLTPERIKEILARY